MRCAICCQEKEDKDIIWVKIGDTVEPVCQDCINALSKSQKLENILEKSHQERLI